MLWVKSVHNLPRIESETIRLEERKCRATHDCQRRGVLVTVIAVLNAVMHFCFRETRGAAFVTRVAKVYSFFKYF